MENYSFLDDKHHLGYVFTADTQSFAGLNYAEVLISI